MFLKLWALPDRAQPTNGSSEQTVLLKFKLTNDLTWMAVVTEVTCTLTELQKFSVQEGPIISAAPQPLTLHAIMLVPKIYEITLLRGCQVVFKRGKTTQRCDRKKVQTSTEHFTRDVWMLLWNWPFLICLDKWENCPSPSVQSLKKLKTWSCKKQLLPSFNSLNVLKDFWIILIKFNSVQKPRRPVLSTVLCEVNGKQRRKAGRMFSGLLQKVLLWTVDLHV